MVLVSGTGVADGVHDERYEVGLLELQGPPRVEPGEQQQILDEQRHPPGLGLDPPERVPGVGPDVLSSASGQLGVPANGGEGSAQLVTGVGDELPDPRLALLPCVQRPVDVIEHPVERGTDLADLGVRIGLGVGHPFAEVHLAGVQGSSETRVAVAATRRRGRVATPMRTGRRWRRRPVRRR